MRKLHNGKLKPALVEMGQLTKVEPFAKYEGPQNESIEFTV
jgi:hypothetical protein